MDVRLLSTALETASEIGRFAAAHRQSGGIASFVGQVRAESGADAVLELELSHSPPLTLPGIAALAEAAGFTGPDVVEMPANNLSVIFRRAG